jgi:hypothetical protein
MVQNFFWHLKNVPSLVHLYFHRVNAELLIKQKSESE